MKCRDWCLGLGFVEPAVLDSLQVFKHYANPLPLRLGDAPASVTNAFDKPPWVWRTFIGHGTIASEFPRSRIHAGMVVTSGSANPNGAAWLGPRKVTQRPTCASHGNRRWRFSSTSASAASTRPHRSARAACNPSPNAPMQREQDRVAAVAPRPPVVNALT